MVGQGDISLLPPELVKSSLSALKLSGDRPLTRELGAERMEKKNPERSEHAADRPTSNISTLWK